MATQNLDLDEQETIANLKYFWKRWGKLISAAAVVLGLVFASYAAYQWWQSNQEQKAAIVYEQLNKAVLASDAARTQTIFKEMKAQFGSSNYTAMAALLAARMSYEKLDVPAAKEALQWVIQSRVEPSFKDLAKLRLAGLLVEAKDYAGVVALLGDGVDPAFEGLAADRLGDALYLQNKPEQAAVQYQKAYAALGEQNPYRKMVEVKLDRLGLALPPPTAAAAASSENLGSIKAAYQALIGFIGGWFK